jgi:C4-dicarboxylate-specific signal transduction histidine kinase
MNNLDTISREALRAGEIIRHLRGFVGRGRIEPAPMEVNAVVRSAAAMLAPKARASGIGLELDLTETPLPVMGVPVQIEQVLLNLVLNAIDAIRDTGEAQGRITVETKRVEDMAQVSVRDTGPGIKDAERLFEPLVTTKDYGLGVGLRISRSLVEAHGGRLWAEPRVPGGIFHFVLPLAPH